MSDDDEPVEPVSIESYCATLRNLIDVLRATPPEDLPPGITAKTIESLERTLRVLELPPSQEPDHAHHP